MSTNIYYVNRNRCNCHPETCCCSDWAVYRPNGEKYAPFYAKEIAEEVAKALTVYHHEKSKYIESVKDELDLLLTTPETVIKNTDSTPIIIEYFCPDCCIELSPEDEKCPKCGCVFDGDKKGE